jgi:hypothetical protein
MKTAGIFSTVIMLSAAAWAQSDPLEHASVQQVAAQAPGAKMVAPFFKGSAPKTDWSLMLEAGNCYWFSGVSAGKVEKIAMYLWGPTGFFRLTDVKSPSGQATLAWCAKESGMYKFQTKIEGTGNYVVGVFAKEGPKQAAAAPPVPTEKAAPNLGPLCDKRAASAAPGAHRMGDYFEGSGNSSGHVDRSDFPIQMDAGRCYWIIGCGEPDHIKTLALFLWGPNNKRITEAKSDNNYPMLGHCAKETGMFKFQAKITGGNGSYKVGIYTK